MWRSRNSKQSVPNDPGKIHPDRGSGRGYSLRSYRCLGGPMDNSVNGSGAVKRYESRRGGMSAGCMGCLVVAVILLALALGGGIYSWMNWKSWAAGFIEATAAEIVNASELTEEQKTAVKAEFSTIVQKFKDGEVTLGQLKDAGKILIDSPILPAGLALAANSAYIAPSTLTDEEKTDARVQISRFAHGVIEKKIA